MKKLEMKELITMLVIPACIVFAVLTLGMCVGHAEGFNPAKMVPMTVSNIEWYVSCINGGRNAEGSQVEYLSKYYGTHTMRDGKPVFNCMSRAEVIKKLFVANGYESTFDSKLVYGTVDGGNKHEGDHHMFLWLDNSNASGFEKFLRGLLGDDNNGAIRCGDIWSIDKAN